MAYRSGSDSTSHFLAPCPESQGLEAKFFRKYPKLSRKNKLQCSVIHDMVRKSGVYTVQPLPNQQFFEAPPMSYTEVKFQAQQPMGSVRTKRALLRPIICKKI